MISFEKRRAQRALSVLGLSLFLTACGGGGGDSDSGTDGGTAGGGGGTESATLLADIEQPLNGTAVLRVWDPAQPTALVASQIATHHSDVVHFSWARSFDAATRTERQTARTLAAHSGGGRVWLTDLRGGQSHTPRQLSSLDLASRIHSVVPLALDGTTAWVNASANSTSGVGFAVHSGMSSTDTPLRGQVLAALPDSAGAGRYIVVATSNGAGETGLTVLAADGSSVGFTAVSGGSLGIVWIGFDPAQTGRAYVVVNQQLRRLIWTDTGVSLDASFSRAMANTYNPSPVGDATGLWLKDGAALLHIVGDDITTVGTYFDAPYELWDAGDTMVARLYNDSGLFGCCTFYQAMNKVTGVVTEVFGGVESAVGFGINDRKALFGLIENSSLGRFDRGWSVVDMQGHASSQGAGTILGAVYSAERSVGQAPALLGFLVCTKDPSSGLCGAGPVSQYGLDGVSQLTLGELPAGTTINPPMQMSFVAGVPTSMAILDTNVSSRNLWQFTPGMAGSLKRVTQHLP